MSAEAVIRRLNPRALIAHEDGHLVAIEDWKDPDGRMYRVEYRSTVDGRHAVAFCLYNPWGGRNGGAAYSVGHVAEDGFLCLGSDHLDRRVEHSPYSLDWVVPRVRYWCTAFSVFKETGAFPQL